MIDGTHGSRGESTTAGSGPDDGEAEITADALPWALADDLIAAQVEAMVLGESARPKTLGRYRIERGLGSGAMGRLLLGFDPDLQRSVALKLITPAQASSPEARERIVREARAMARLSDPNVAQVYEVGEAEGQLFVAIEYVDGHDVRKWLDEHARPWDEVLEVFRQAGSGLAAAHDKGIVHRDFKPDNVMLERDGRARVVDFGLAAPGHGDGAAPGQADSGPVELTRTGALVGTPAYLAPEQWEGGGASPKSDQYAFCVSLFEALTGERPFVGSTALDVRDAQQKGAMQAWPRAVPAWIGRIVRRGLHADPGQRWPDMRGLVATLDPSRRRRRFVGVGVGAALVLALGLAIRPVADPCESADAPLADVWNDGRRAAIADGIARADQVWGAATASMVTARLEDNAEAWSAAAREQCGARRRAQANPAAQACLDDALGRFEGMATALAEGTPSMLVSAVGRAELLPDPRRCPEAPALAAYSADATDPRDVDAMLAAVESSLGATSVHAGASRFGEALAEARRQVQAAVSSAEAIGHEPRLAHALWLSGRLHLTDSKTRPAERDLRRALVLAEQADEAPLIAAITSELVYAVGRDRERAREAEDLATQASGMIEALGRPPLLAARLASHRASAIAHAPDGDRDRAVELHEQAVATLHETLGPEHPTSVAALGNLAAALNYANRPEDAEIQLRTAVDRAHLVWGDNHPRTAVLLGTLGFSRMRQRDLTGAEKHLRRSLEIREAALGSDHPQVDDARYNLASALRRADRHAEALGLLETGLANLIQRHGASDGRLGPWWTATGESALAIDRHARAREALTAAIRIFERTGATARDYARVRFALARAWSPQDPTKARALAEQARADAEQAKATTKRSEIEAFLATL